MVLGSRSSPLRHCIEHRAAARGSGKAVVKRAQRAEILWRPRGLTGDVIKRLVLEDARARHILGLRLALAPGGEFHEHGQRLRRLDAHLQPLPSLLGMKLVGGGIGEHRHLFVEPARTLGAVELGAELGVEVAEMGDVAKRVSELALRQRPPAPIGEARGLVEVAVQHPLHQHRIAHGLAEAADHGRDLGVEDRVRDRSRQMMNDFNVLARGMKDLEHPLIGHQVEERREVEAGREAVDENLGAVRRHLDQAELRPEGLLAHELGIDRHKGGTRRAGRKPRPVHRYA